MLALYKRDELIVQLDFSMGKHTWILCDPCISSWYSARSGHLEETRKLQAQYDLAGHACQTKCFLPSLHMISWDGSSQNKIFTSVNVDQSARIRRTCDACMCTKQNLSTRNLHQLCTHVSGCTGTKHGCMHVCVCMCQCALQVASLRSLTRAPHK